MYKMLNLILSLLLLLPNPGFQIGQVVHELLGLFIIGLAFWGELQASGRAGDQPDLKIFFQLIQVRTDQRLGFSQSLACGSNGAGFNHGNKAGH